MHPIQERLSKLSLLNRFPKSSQIAPVYAMIVLMVYGWTIIWFFWKLPSWLNFMSMGEIAVVLAYALAMNFLESLCVLLLPLLACALAPRTWFYDQFVTRGTALVMLVLGYAMFLTLQLQNVDGYPKNLILLSLLAFAVILVLASLIGRVGILRKLLESLSDRAIVFLYLSIPASLVSVLVVVIRNTF